MAEAGATRFGSPRAMRRRLGDPRQPQLIRHCASERARRQALLGKLESIAHKEGRSLDSVSFGFLRCGYASDNESEIMAYLDNARFQRRQI